VKKLTAPPGGTGSSIAQLSLSCGRGSRPECWNFRSQELSLPGAKVPRMELSFPGAKIPWNFRSQERKGGGTFAPKSKKVVELSLSIRNR